MIGSALNVALLRAVQDVEQAALLTHPPRHVETCLSPSFVLASSQESLVTKYEQISSNPAASLGGTRLGASGVGRVRRVVFLNILRASSISTSAIQFTSSTYSNGFSPVG